ncbi:MAG: hypothetical protein AAFX00_11955 [Pseudomonadota bacterium]
MKHGHIQNQTFAGFELLTPPSIGLHGKIGLPIHKTYRFVGYKTSILRYMMDNKDCVVNGANDHGFTIQMAVGEVAKTAGEQYADAFRGAALGAVGEFSTAIDAMNNVLDGLSVVGMINDILDGDPPGGVAPVRPDKKAYAWDHAMGTRIIVDLSLYKGEKDRWLDLGATTCTLHTIAYLMHNT